MGIEYDVIKLQHDVANLARYLEEHCKRHPESVKVAELPKSEPVLTIDQCAVGMELIATDNVDLTIWTITKVSPLWIKSPHGNPFFIPSERIGEFRIHRPAPKSLKPEEELPFVKVPDPEAYVRKWAEEHGVKICEPDEIPVEREWLNELIETLEEEKDSITYLLDN
jgi:hypothetical protein